jgi:Protein of Unknown function (DUF2784)
MLYRFLADGVLILHFCFILFVVFGGILLIRWRKIAFLHVPAVIWAFLVQWFQWICPITPLEIWFRERGGDAGYEGGFIEHYILPVIYIDAGRWLHITLAFAAVVFNLIVYFYVFRRFRNSND